MTYEIKNHVDEKTFSEFLLSLSKDTLYQFNHFGEQIDAANVGEIVKGDLSRPDKIRFFLFDGGTLAGYSYIILFKKPTMKHAGSLGLVISDKFQGRGYGKILLSHTVKYGWDKLGLTRMWSNVYSDNIPALKMNLSAGLTVEGVFKNSELTQKGYRDTIAFSILRNKG